MIEQEKKTDISISVLLATIPQTVIAFLESQADLYLCKNIQNPDVKNVVVVFKKNNKKNLSCTKVKGKISPEAVLTIYSINKHSEVLVHL